ncbi:MAG: DUF4856 domain-containing protein [Neptuniibacter caesariensis]|uniref:DUF4856 domain-containing protein n=1 Tax=Neptuniibacter caesariensis TaxID=207954 RepID=A0A2G6JPD9_NEPCE|nr:MAG: DUF4856 domain-containing protein [Neptuniibacter caesariensis]
MKLKTLVSAMALAAAANVAATDTYSDFPVTVKGYKGDAKHSVAYTGQAARQVLHNSLKKLAGKGNGHPNAELKAQMLAYFAGKDAGREIISPATKGDFVIAEKSVDELSKGKNLAGKTYKGAVPGWPGNMTGPEVIAFMIDKASAANKGYDPLTGYDYTQLISKFAMGAVFYNQAVDNYLDEKLAADNKPNNKPYKAGKPYTGKEHVWDEAFGYFGAPAHALALSPKQAYSIAKLKADAFALADADKDGEVSLYDEMVYAHAYYAAGADKSGKTNYFHTIMQAFIDGRQLITDAKGEALTDSQRQKLKGYAKIIADNWEKVIAEAVFKYAGSTYKDLKALEELIENNGDASKAFRKYAKHWGELKGFALALQAGKNNLGETAVKLNRLIGYGPVLLGNTQVTGIDANGNYVQSSSTNMKEYMLHMLKVQKLMVDEFGVEARSKDVMADLGSLADKLSSGASVEND